MALSSRGHQRKATWQSGEDYSLYDKGCLWRASLTPEDRNTQADFLTSTFTRIDQILQDISMAKGSQVPGKGGAGGSAAGKGFFDSHPLGRSVLNGLLLARELLNCWQLGSLHDVAIVSLTDKLEQLTSFVQEARATSPPLEMTRVSTKHGSGSFKAAEPLLVVDELRFDPYGKKFGHSLSLSRVEKVEDAGAGSCDFTVWLNGGEKHMFRTSMAAEKQRWLALFKAKAQERFVRMVVSSITPTEVASLYSSTIFSNLKGIKASEDFLFATTALAQLSRPPPAANNPQSNAAATLSLLPSAGAEQQPGRAGLLSHVMSVRHFGISERFKAKWVQVMGKDKDRQLRISLQEPHRLDIFKPLKVKGKSKGTQGEIGTHSFTREELQWYKLEGLVLELCFLSSKRKGEQDTQPTTPELARAKSAPLRPSIFKRVPKSPRSPAGLGRLEEDAREVTGSSRPPLQLSSSKDDSSDSAKGVGKSVELFKRKFFLEDSSTAQRVRLLLQMFVAPSPEDVPEFIHGDVMGALYRRQLSCLHPEAKKKVRFLSERVHMLFASLFALAPNNLHCKHLLELSNTTELSPRGDAWRLQGLVAVLCGTGRAAESRHKAIACLCHETRGACLLQLTRALIHVEALGDLLRCMRQTDGESESGAPSLRSWAIRATWGLLECAQLSHRCRGALDAEVLPQGAGLTAVQRPFIFYIDQAIQESPMDLLSLQALFEILIGEIQTHVPDSDALAVQNCRPAKPVNVLGKNVQQDSVFPVLLHALAHTPLEAAGEALRNLVLLLRERGNALKMIKIAGWQNCFFPLIMRLHRSKWSEGMEADKEAYHMSISLVVQLHFHHMEVTPMTSPSVSNANSHVVASSVRYLLRARGLHADSVVLCSRWLGGLVSMLESHIVLFTGNYDSESSGYPKLFAVLNVLLQYIFFTPLPEDKHATSAALVDQPANADLITPLMVAAQKNNLQMVRHLVEVLRADSELLDKMGRSALDWAVAAQAHETADYLRKHKEVTHQQRGVGTNGGGTVCGLHVAVDGSRLVLDAELLKKIVSLTKSAKFAELSAHFDSGIGKLDKKARQMVQTGKAFAAFFEMTSQVVQAMQREGVGDEELRVPLQQLSQALYSLQKKQGHMRSKAQCSIAFPF